MLSNENKSCLIDDRQPRLPTLTCGEIDRFPKLSVRCVIGPPKQETDVSSQNCHFEALRTPRLLTLTILFGSILLSIGCLRRRMTVRTSPPGAMVYVDRQYIGLSPVSTNYTYYGTREIETVRDGYRTDKFLRKFNPPWYEIPPLDFVTETLWPYEVRDERIIDVQMSPELSVPNDALIASGEQLRLQAGQGIAVSPPPTMSAPIPVVPQNPPR